MRDIKLRRRRFALSDGSVVMRVSKINHKNTSSQNVALQFFRGQSYVYLDAVKFHYDGNNHRRLLGLSYQIIAQIALYNPFQFVHRAAGKVITFDCS